MFWLQYVLFGFTCKLASHSSLLSQLAPKIQILHTISGLTWMLILQALESVRLVSVPMTPALVPHLA